MYFSACHLEGCHIALLTMPPPQQQIENSRRFLFYILATRVVGEFLIWPGFRRIFAAGMTEIRFTLSLYFFVWEEGNAKLSNIFGVKMAESILSF
ncbi:hypothetical protein CEXT_588281 [Caerostris extrusa]|uniref:Uncharacterized protein n=1 Tax=Caerostris extrusa TaxID=172846 RepID=A0AAV4Q3B2_CAEEX|nr:hypothetical protein CEXT_588281 [Caerostris extrusa]